MSLGCSSPEDVTKAIANEGVQFIDVKFTDLFGQWQHFTLPTEQYDEEGVFGRVSASTAPRSGASRPSRRATWS